MDSQTPLPVIDTSIETTVIPVNGDSLSPYSLTSSTTQSSKVRSTIDQAREAETRDLTTADNGGLAPGEPTTVEFQEEDRPIVNPVLDDSFSSQQMASSPKDNHINILSVVDDSIVNQLKFENQTLKDKIEELMGVLKLKDDKILELTLELKQPKSITKEPPIQEEKQLLNGDQLENYKSYAPPPPPPPPSKQTEQQSLDNQSIRLMDPFSPALSDIQSFAFQDDDHGVQQHPFSEQNDYNDGQIISNPIDTTPLQNNPQYFNNEQNSILNPLDTPLRQQESLERSTTPQSKEPSPEVEVTEIKPEETIPLELPERSERRTVLRDSTVSMASSSYSNALSPLKIRSPVGMNPLASSMEEAEFEAPDSPDSPSPSNGKVLPQVLIKDMTLGSSPRRNSPKKQRHMIKNSPVSPLKNAYTRHEEDDLTTSTSSLTNHGSIDDDEFTFNNDSASSLTNKEPVYKSLGATTPVKKQTANESDILQSYMNSNSSRDELRGSEPVGLNIQKRIGPPVLESEHLNHPTENANNNNYLNNYDSDYSYSQLHHPQNKPQENQSVQSHSPTPHQTLPPPPPLTFSSNRTYTPPNVQSYPQMSTKTSTFKSDVDSLYSITETPTMHTTAIFGSPSQSAQDRQSSITKTPSPQKKSYTPQMSTAVHQNHQSSNSYHSQNPSDSSQFDYLSNSFDTTVITVNSCVDIDAVTNKQEDFKIKFMVNSSERELLIPLYMVTQHYSNFIKLDMDIRRMSPIRLPSLPDKSAFLKIDPPVWDTQKSIVKMYMSELCRVMRLQKGSNVWKVFKEFFTPDEAHDMSRKESTFASVSTRNLKKVYKLIKLSYDTIENQLTVSEPSLKYSETFNVNDLSVSVESQVLNIGRKKKKTFKSNKHFVLYAESVYDAEEWSKLIYENQENDNDQVSVASSPSHNHSYFSNISNSGDQGSMSTSTSIQQELSLPSPSAHTPTHTPAPHEGKWFGFKRSRDSTMLQVTAPSMLSTPSSDVLEFKAMPYSGTMTSSGTTNSNNTVQLSNSSFSSPNKSEPVFQKFDTGPKYFGSTLSESFAMSPDFKIYGKPVPSIVFRCISYLTEKKAVYQEGIFRLNGMMSEVKKIQDKFCESFDCDLTALKPPPDVHSIATLLKRYLRTLRITIIPEHEAKQLMSLTLSTDFKSTIPQIKAILDSLPKLNFDVLYVIFKYFTEVLKCREFNKMSVSALSVLMAPNLTPFDGAKEISSELLINYKFYFENSGTMLAGDAERAAV